MDNTAANKKDLEANGHVDETTSEGSSEQFNTERKSSRRMEYVYISIAVVLGAALIAVLVYFTVTNAMKTVPESVTSMDSVTTTEDPNDQIDYDSLFNVGSNDGDTGSNGGNGGQFNLDDMNSLLRAAPPRGLPSGQSGSNSETTPAPTTARSFSMVGGGRPNPSLLLRRQLPLPGSVTTEAPRREFRVVGAAGNPSSDNTAADTSSSSPTPTTTTTTSTTNAASSGNNRQFADMSPVLLQRGSKLRQQGQTSTHDPTTTTSATSLNENKVIDEASDNVDDGMVDTHGVAGASEAGGAAPRTDGDDENNALLTDSMPDLPGDGVVEDLLGPGGDSGVEGPMLDLPGDDGVEGPAK